MYSISIQNINVVMAVVAEQWLFENGLPGHEALFLVSNDLVLWFYTNLSLLLFNSEA